MKLPPFPISHDFNPVNKTNPNEKSPITMVPASNDYNPQIKSIQTFNNNPIVPLVDISAKVSEPLNHLIQNLQISANR